MSFDNIVSLKLKGSNFNNETELRLFEKYDHKKGNIIVPNSIIYGKNGSGKSTIGRAFKYISDGKDCDIQTAALFDDNNNEIKLEESEKQRIHVFNEDYIKANVDLPDSEDGLKTIVVLGEKVEVESQLKLAEEEYNLAKVDLDNKKALVEKYNNPKDEESPFYYEAKMTAILKGDDAWARRDADICEKANKTTVKSDKYKEFGERKSPKENRSELLLDYVTKLDDLKAARNGEKTIEPAIKISENYYVDVEKLNILLPKKIEEPTLTERDKYLLTLKKKLGDEHIGEIKTRLYSEDRCPLCLQDLSPQYKEDLFKSIENILSKEAENHAKELYDFKLQTVQFDFETYKKLDSVLITNAKQNLDALNDTIEECIKYIQQKIDDIYTPVNVQIDFKDKYSAFVESLKALESARVEYNKQIADTSVLEAELKDINNNIAYYDIKDDYSTYKKKNIALANATKELNAAQKKVNDKKAIVKNLEEQKKSIKIACDNINDGLKYIFFANDRLSIESEGDKYILKSRGQNVMPKNVSVGERNAIALCYFFSEIMKNQKEEDVLKNQYLIIIDDPISSFDMDNRIGILSYIKSQVTLFARGNNKTHFLILTHDLQTAYDLDNVFKGLSKTSLELVDNKVYQNDMDNRNEYSQLMKRIYSYAKDGNESDSLYIGNAMRRVVEAFSTFVYKDKMVNLPSLAKNQLGNDAIYFGNLMYRLVLNGESHSETRMHVMLNDDFLEYIKPEEKRYTAKAILCMLYRINKEHVIHHITGDGIKSITITDTIDKWLTEIANEHNSNNTEIKESTAITNVEELHAKKTDA